MRQRICIDKCVFKEMGEKISTPIFTEKGKHKRKLSCCSSIKTHSLPRLGITLARGKYELKDGFILIIVFYFFFNRPAGEMFCASMTECPVLPLHSEDAF